MKSGFFTGFGYGLFDIALFGIMAIGLWFGSKLVIEGEITVTEFFGFFSVLTSTFSLGTVSVQCSIIFGNTFQKFGQIIKRLFSITENLEKINSNI